MTGHMICLAAGRGTRVRPYTDDTPKCMLEVAGRPLLHWQVDTARRVGIEDVVVVTGYLADGVQAPGIRTAHNPAFASTNMVRSLWCAEEALEGTVIVSYGDILYEPRVLQRLLEDPAPIGVVVDTGWRAYWEARHEDPVEDAESLALDEAGRITSIGQPVESLGAPEAQYIGLMAFQGEGVGWLREAYEVAKAADAEGRHPFGGPRDLDGLYMTDLLQGIVDMGHPVSAVPVDRGWIEIDTPEDYQLARKLVEATDQGLRVRG